MMKKKGVIRALYLSTILDEQVERTRGKLGLNRNAFYKYAALRLLQELSVLSDSVQRECPLGDSEDAE
jgi:hypothetical protein